MALNYQRRHPETLVLVTADSTAGGAARPAAPPSQQHTGAAVPIYGIGPNSDEILGTTDHTDRFDIMQGR